MQILARQEKIKHTRHVNIVVGSLGFCIMLPVTRIDLDDRTFPCFIMAFITLGPSAYSILSDVLALVRTDVPMNILLGIISSFFRAIHAQPKLVEAAAERIQAHIIRQRLEAHDTALSAYQKGGMVAAEINAILAAEFCQDLLAPVVAAYEDEKARILG